MAGESSRTTIPYPGGRTPPRLNGKELGKKVAPNFSREFEAYEPDMI